MRCAHRPPLRLGLRLLRRRRPSDSVPSPVAPALSAATLPAAACSASGAPFLTTTALSTATLSAAPAATLDAAHSTTLAPHPRRLSRYCQVDAVAALALASQ